MDQELNQIYFSEKMNIAYDDDIVNINGKNLTIDSFAEEFSSAESNPKDFAYKKMRSVYSAELSRQYEEIIILSGSGTSVGIGIEDKTGKTMAELWDSVVDTIGMGELTVFFDTIKYDIKSKNLEELLSKAKISQTFLNDSSVQTIIDNIESIIKDKCTLELPDSAPHLRFLRKLTARKLKYSRAKIFTLNYDLLFEQAAMRGGYVIIDGFSFSYPRIFNGLNFDYDIVLRNNNRALSEENYASNVFHLYKPHGSLDWEKDKKSGLIRKTENPQSPLMIYPNSSKYEYSYEQPFFEMISRFQQELRNKNILLIVIGFSFNDSHIKAMICEALNSNPSLTLFVVSPSIHNEVDFLELKKKSTNMGNIHLINETFIEFVKNYPSSEIYDNFYSEEKR